MKRPILTIILVAIVCANEAPLITIAHEDAHIPSSAGAAHLAPGSDVMQQLLNWGIEHSDPEKLKELMQKYQEKNLTIKDVYGQDVIDALFVNEGSVMKDMIMQIGDFDNVTVTDEDLEDALLRLQELVDQVDNAGNLHRNGGLRPLLNLGVRDETAGSESARRSESVRSLALWTLGIAVQNNPPVQTDLIDIGGLPSLIGRLALCTRSESGTNSGDEYCSKLIFALSGLVKNNGTIQTAADTQGLFMWLVDEGIAHTSLGIVKKSLALLDIALSQNPNLNFLRSLPAKQDKVAASLLACIDSKTSDIDTDAVEKALRLLNRFLALRPMLFAASFKSDLAASVESAVKRCELMHGIGDELCEGLASLGKTADLALVAREISDEEL
jgi:hypothetical protein